MRKAVAFGLLFAVLVMMFGLSGIALADRSPSVEHKTPSASMTDADTETDGDRTISGERIDGDVETAGDVVVTDGSRIMGDVEAEGDVTISNSRIDGDVEADGDVTVEASGVNDDIEADGDVLIEGDSGIGGDVEAEGDATITDSRIDGDVETEGSARITASLINEDVDAEGTVELADGSRINGDVDAGADVVISEHSEVDGDIDADGDVIDEDEQAVPERSDPNSAGQEGETTITEGDDEDGSVTAEDDVEADEGQNNDDEDERESDGNEDERESDDGDEQERDGNGVERESDDDGNEPERDDDEDEREGTFEILTASLSNTVIAAGESLQLGLQVENAADGDETFDTDLLVDGETVDSASTTIEAGGTGTITFSYQFEDPGEYEIALSDRSLDTVTVTPADDDKSGLERSVDDATAIEIVQATVPADWVKDGYETSVRVTVENTANRTASRTLTVTIDDQPVTNETVTLQPYERDEMTVEFEAAAGSVAVEDVVAGWIDTGERDDGDDLEEEDTEESAGFGFEVGIAALLVIVGSLAGVAVLRP